MKASGQTYDDKRRYGDFKECFLSSLEKNPPI